MTEYVNKEYYNSIKGNCAYIDLNGDNIHKVMDRLRAEGIMFSATYGSYRNTVTVSKADAQRAYAIASEYKNTVQNNQRIIGNIEYSKIRDRSFINTDPETALQVANLLSGDASIRFSGRILANSATITVSGRKNAEMVNRMIDNIHNADIINELFRAGYERLADTNGFVNIRNNETGETVGFRNMDMVCEMYNDGNNEFFHPSAYRIDKAEETYYISESNSTTADERNVYIDTNGGVPVFESRYKAEEYASDNGIELSDFEKIISEENVPPEHLEISNEPLSVQLSERLSAEYNFFVSNLMNQKPEVIISSAYEINTKDNIRTYAENEELDLTDEQIKALLSSENVLNEAYQEWNKNEFANSYDDVLTVVRDRADRILLSQERSEKEHIKQENVPVEHQEEAVFSNVPVYAKSLSEARELDELEIYRASRNENHACANVTDAFISKHYNDNSLDSEGALNDLLERYPIERIALVSAVNIADKNLDGRISNENKAWANAFLEDYPDDVMRQKGEYYLTAHPGLVNLFADTVRSYIEKNRELAPEQKEQEQDEIYDALDLEHNSITFSVVTIDGENRFVVPEYVDKYDIHGLEAYQDYISENQSDEASVSVEFCMIGALDNESVTASYDEADFIEEHLDDVMKSEYTTSLEYNEYSIETPEEMLESRQEDIQLEKAKEYIRSYLVSEFAGDEEAEFDDLEHISAGYTELGENNEYGFQMKIDLVSFRISYMLNEELVKAEKYNSLKEMNELALSELNFDEFYSIGTDAAAELENRNNHLVIPDLGIDVDMREIDHIEVQTPDDKLMFYYSTNSNDIERAWESDDNSDTAVSIDEVRNDLINAQSAGFSIAVREKGYEKKTPENLLWKEIPESIDEETGKPTSWAAEINSDTYGRFLWISQNENNSYDVEYDTGEKIIPVSSESAGFSSLSAAKKWAEEFYSLDKEASHDAADILAEKLTAHHPGKFMIEEYYNSKAPTAEELSAYIQSLVLSGRQGFGLDGYSADANGIILSDLSEYSWEQVGKAVMTALDRGTYITTKERAERANAPKYSIYQVKKGEEYSRLSFNSWSELKKFNLPFDKNNYEEVYGGYVSDVSRSHGRGVILDNIYTKFNIDRPEDFRGHSLSVSDIIVLEDKNSSSAFFVDSYGMTEVTDLFFDLEKQNIDISKLSEITLTEEYDRRRDQPDDFLHIKNTISFSNLNSSYLISRYKEFTYEYDVLPDADEGDTFTARQGMLAEVQEFFEDSRSDSTKSISITDLNGKTTVLEGRLFEFDATEDRLAFMIPNVGYAEMFERDDDSYDYTIYDSDFNVKDSGVYDDVSISLRQAVTIILEDAGYDIDRCEPMDFEKVHGRAEEKEEQSAPASDTGRKKSGNEVEVGDVFLYNGREYTVESEKGIYPDDVGISYLEQTGGVTYLATQNIDRYKLAENGIFLGNPNKVQEEEAPLTESQKSEYVPKIGDLIDINDELLSISDISGSIITFTETENLLGNTSRMSISDFLASDFTVVEEAEREAAPDVPVEHFEAEAEVETVNVPVEHHTSNARNYVITDDNLGVKTPKARFAANVEAIRTLNAIEAEQRTATPSEQAVLSGYTGWGAIPQAFDSDNKEWSNEYAELKELLSDEEYMAARRSTMNAHFTSPIIINAIYEGLANIGFESGKILEPAMGIGNFFGVMPEAMRTSELHGVELDSLTGRIAKQLYPDADIQIKGFEKTKFGNDSFDLVVGNVPFGDYKVDDKDYNKHKFYIHDYFVAKSIDKVRPGGVLAVITSKGTMDKENPEMRTYIAQRAELLGAIRLPNDAFKKNAGTEVTSDILFFQKRERPIEIKPEEVEWLSKGTTEDGFSVNNYFVNHPEMVLGTIAEANQMYGPTENTQVLPIEGTDLKTQLSEAMKNIHGTYTPQTRKAEKKKDTEDIIPAPANSRTYSYYAVSGSIYYRGDDETMSKVKLSGDGLKRALAMVEIRDTVRELLDMQLDNADHSLDGDISEKREKLNQLYDSFTVKYGHFDDKKNARLFKGDDGYSFLTALETRDKDSGEYTKADIFYHDTVKPNSVVEHVETAQEALILSVAERAKVDFDYMTELCGMDKDTLINELEGQIFRLPQEEEKYVTADEYLTGNIRQKLRELNNAPVGMDVSRHREALEAAMPKKVEAKDISVKLGSHWVAPEFVTQFINEKFRPGWKSNIEAQYSKASGKWKIEGASKSDKGSYTATHDFGTRRKDAYAILEGILNHEDLTVKDPKLDENGEPMRDSRDNIIKVTNHEETKAVQSMVRKIESAWQDWIFKDPDRRTALVDKYNEVFNSIRHREYDGSHLNFVGMNSDITLKEHQKNAVARALYGGNTMLAHCVGAGKSYEMITIAMEGKRLGLHHKSLFAVPNSLTEQMGRDFQKLYPAANILVAAKKDFEPKNRRELFAKIATGEWDAVIVGHSQFDRMGLSKERMEKYMQAEIDSLRSELEEARSTDGSKSFSVKEIERTIARYEKRIKDDQGKVAKDDYIDFEEMGFDKLFVDECHLYKNLGTATKMSNVAGIGTTGSGKAAELLMKTKYLDEITGGKGLVFASGTPVSNSMTELYTMMRYLQTALLKECDINHFDEWAADFGEVKTDYELKPESDGKYQLKTRFAKFTNLPELMGMFKEAADVRTADTLDLEKPVSHVHEVVAQPSKIQKRLIKSLAKRAAKIRDGNVDPKEDNMLCVTNDGRKIGLDQRLMQPGCPDNPNSKVNMCVNNVFDIYTKTAPNRSTQVIFCDMSTPKSDARQDRFEIYRPDKSKDSGFDLIRKKVGLGSGDEDRSKRISSFADIKSYVDKYSPDAEDKLQEGDIAVFRIPSEDGTSIESRAAVYTNGQLIEDNSYDLLDSLGMSPIEAMPEKPFNVYDDIRNKLIGLGVSEKEIAFIHDYDTAEKKQALFNQMNNGEVRVLLGSTAKCGAGMNSQQKMIALHHLDAPLRPSDMEQRNGRIERQGNENPEVDIFRYVTDKSFDAYLYQILENKQKFISQVMTSKTPERVCSDIDEQSLDYAEVKALCAGNPLIKKEMELQAQIKDLKSEKARYNENLYEIQDNIRVKYPNEIKQNASIIKKFTADLNTAKSASKVMDEEGREAYTMTLAGRTYTSRKEAGEAFKEALGKNMGLIMEGKEIALGEYRGLTLSVMFNDFRRVLQACLRGEKAHYCDLNASTDIGNIVRLDNAINNIQKTIDDLSAKNDMRKSELEQMKIDVEKPFEKEQELLVAEAELEDVHTKLTQLERTDDSAQKDMFERLVDSFPEIITGEKSYIKYEAECFMPLHVEMNSDILTIAQTYVQNGDLMYDPRIDFQVDYENKKVIPKSFENSGEGVYEQYNISDGKPETMKQINDILTFADDWMDRIEEQGYSEVNVERCEEHSKDYSR